MRESPSKLPVALGLLAATAGVVGLTAAVRRLPPAAPGPLKPEFAAPAPEPAPPAPRVRRHSTPPRPVELREPEPAVRETPVFRSVRLEGDSPVLGKEMALKAGQEPHLASLSATMANLGYADIRILKVDVERGLATIDASPKLLDHGFSSTAEAALVKSIATDLGQFPAVKTFRLRVDGEVLDTLGHLELAEPQAVIRPGEASPAEEAGGDTPSRPPSP